jgi:hypothetical protein
MSMRLKVRVAVILSGAEAERNARLLAELMARRNGSHLSNQSYDEKKADEDFVEELQDMHAKAHHVLEKAS